MALVFCTRLLSLDFLLPAANKVCGKVMFLLFLSVHRGGWGGAGYISHNALWDRLTPLPVSRPPGPRPAPAPYPAPHPVPPPHTPLPRPVPSLPPAPYPPIPPPPPRFFFWIFWFFLKKAVGAGGMPLAVTQEDCLVEYIFSEIWINCAF